MVNKSSYGVTNVLIQINHSFIENFRFVYGNINQENAIELANKLKENLSKSEGTLVDSTPQTVW